MSLSGDDTRDMANTLWPQSCLSKWNHPTCKMADKRGHILLFLSLGRRSYENNEFKSLQNLTLWDNKSCNKVEFHHLDPHFGSIYLVSIMTKKVKPCTRGQCSHISLCNLSSILTGSEFQRLYYLKNIHCTLNVVLEVT